MSAITDRAGQLGDDAHTSDWLDHAVRGGLVAYGVVHLLIAWLALRLALGDREGEASSTGAMQELAQQPFGSTLIWLVAVGMLLLVVWRVLEAVAGHRERDGADRVRKRGTSVAKAAVYAAVGTSAVKVATGTAGGGGKRSGSDTLTAQVLAWPGGQLVVGAVALGIIGYGAHHLWRAWTEGYTEQLSTEGRTCDAGTAYLWFGKVGYAAKGLAIGLVGGLLAYAAVTHEAKRSGGLDQALVKVLQQPYGPVLLGGIAVGIGCYGLFCFARARHLSR